MFDFIILGFYSCILSTGDELKQLVSL